MNPELSGKGSTPLFIGVTGHRTISGDYAEEVAEQVCEALHEIHALVPHTEICVVTGLADGADRIVARVGLDLGMRVKAVVPKPVERYRSGLTAASQSDFDAFLRRPGVFLTEVPVDSGFVSEGAETELVGQYVAVGHYLATRADLLFVLWDGDLTGLAGGTADVLLRFLGAGEGVSPTPEIRFVNGDETSATGPQFALWFPVSRSQSQTGQVAIEGPVYLTGAGSRCLAYHPSMPEALGRRLHELEQYNLHHAEAALGGPPLSQGA